LDRAIRITEWLFLRARTATLKNYSYGNWQNKTIANYTNRKQTRSSILRNAKNLRKSSTYQNVFISSDLSLKERESNKLLYQELKRRKQAGEVNLIIRRGKIVPKQTNPNPTPVAMHI